MNQHQPQVHVLAALNNRLGIETSAQGGDSFRAEEDCRMGIAVWVEGLRDPFNHKHREKVLPIYVRQADPQAVRNLVSWERSHQRLCSCSLPGPHKSAPLSFRTRFLRFELLETHNPSSGKR